MKKLLIVLLLLFFALPALAHTKATQFAALSELGNADAYIAEPGEGDDDDDDDEAPEDPPAA